MSFAAAGPPRWRRNATERDFWGCDINPLATLIAQVKTHRYRDHDLGRTYGAIREDVLRAGVTSEDRARIGETIRYWFGEDNIDDLIRLDRAIRRTTASHGAHRRFFQCGFSAILKATSYWLTKSIKPQRDPHKEPRAVMEAFEDQVALMRRANKGNVFPRPAATTRIRARNFLGNTSSQDRAELIVTSPPYVTSYNYADIHQLSTLWLGYAADYRALRRNMLGNRYGVRRPRDHVVRKLGDAAWRTYRGHAKPEPEPRVVDRQVLRGTWTRRFGGAGRCLRPAGWQCSSSGTRSTRVSRSTMRSILKPAWDGPVSGGFA